MRNEMSVDSVLAEKFELIQSELSATQVVKFLAQEIANRRQKEMLVISLIGGAASGKSSLAASLVEDLKVSGLKADSICTDDVSMYTRHQRWEKLKDPTVTGLDLHDGQLLNQKIETIRHITGNETVAVPKYDPKTGDAIVVGEKNFPRRIGKLDVLVVEGDFNLVKKTALLVYVEMSASERRRVRIERDLKERDQVGGKIVTAEDIGESFDGRQATQHVDYTEPSVQNANIVLKIHPTNGEWKYDVYETN